MMHTTAKSPDSTPIPVQLSEPEFNQFIFPHLSMPKRGPKGTVKLMRLEVITRERDRRGPRRSALMQPWLCR